MAILLFWNYITGLYMMPYIDTFYMQISKSVR